MLPVTSSARLVLAARTAAVLVATVLTAGCGAVGIPAPPTNAPAAATPGQLVAAPLAVPPELARPPFDRPRQVLIPAGWTMSLWARVPGARLAVWAPDGALLVSRPSTGDVLRLLPRADAADPASSVLLGGLTRPHGLAFTGGSAGETLYVAQSNEIDAYQYRVGAATNRRPVATGLPDAGSADLRGAYAHTLKSVAVGPDGAVYYSVGSTGNISAADRDANPPRAVIMRVPAGGGRAEAFATGVRNGTGLALAPDGSVWTAVNTRDNVRYPYDRPYGGATASSLGELLPAYVADHPVEQLARLTPGRDLGWPYCNPEVDVEPGVAGSGYRPTAAPFVRDVETNADGTKLDCARLAPVEQTIEAHSAPLGLSFAELPAPYGTGALVGLHGSWNRTPPRAPEVSFFAWRDGSLAEQQTLVGGFQAPDGARWGRPVAAVTGPDGAVYVTDDAAGAVYRLAPPGV